MLKNHIFEEKHQKCLKMVILGHPGPVFMEKVRFWTILGIGKNFENFDQIIPPQIIPPPLGPGLRAKK